MAVYCWGNTVHGELGLGGIEDEFILAPRAMDWIVAPKVVRIACGNMHTLLLTKQGKVYSCGNNDYGQLGQELSRKRPRMSKFKSIDLLDNYFIVEVKCGMSHSLVLNEWGQIFSWGSDSCGQLGHGLTQNSLCSPKIVKALATKHIIQIACGNNHNLVLTNNGELFAWGANDYGQLGLGFVCEKVIIPTEINSLTGIPIASIACGGYHSFVISKSGAVFGWGRNSSGQLGLNDECSRSFPTQLKTLRSLGVRYISCGADFSVFLTHDGGVFTCGSGTYGQLGHGVFLNENLPRMIMELMGSTITQVSCGSYHTLALVPSRGRVYGFGLGCSGQLGNRNVKNSATPQVVLGSWLSPSGNSLINSEDEVINPNMMSVKRIFSGSDHCFVSAAEYIKKIPPDDCRFYDNKSQILTLTTELAETCFLAPKDEKVDLDLLHIIELIFKSQACINGSFLLSNDLHFCCTSKRHGVDITEASLAFDHLRKTESESIKQLIFNCICNELISSLVPSPADVETLRIYLIIPLYHEFINAKNYVKLHTPFSEAVKNLKPIALKILSQWWAEQSVDYFESLVANFKGVVWYIINFSLSAGRYGKVITYERNMAVALHVLKLLYDINRKQRKEKIAFEVFYISDLIETVEITADYIQWIQDENKTLFHLCNYPFIFDVQIKTTLLQVDQLLQMKDAMNHALARERMYMLYTGMPVGVSNFVTLNISRQNLVQDTITQISQYEINELKKPLKVSFIGEEAEDEGGVTKEFFMLLLKDILDPKYGMFKEYEDSRAIWFSEKSFEASKTYYLIGVLCGLAIYNFTIINLPFPLALYKKLLKEPTDMSDLCDLSPTLANSLQSILNYEHDDLETVFNLYFDITNENCGVVEIIPLKPDGSDIPVTQENKQEFVDLYIDYIFNKSIDSHFQCFSEAFMKVGGRILELFRPQELMAAVVGSENYDWDTLESEAIYRNGYTSGDQTIRWFWEVFHELDIKEKKKFLLFLTGSDRVPIHGMRAIKIVLQPTNNEKSLPVAHTCFNMLDLPRYKTKERLKYKLLQAIQYFQGFSLV